MKFQNISIHGSKVMQCTRKCDKRTNRQARSNMPPNFFKVGGIKRRQNKFQHQFSYTQCTLTLCRCIQNLKTLALIGAEKSVI